MERVQNSASVGFCRASLVYSIIVMLEGLSCLKVNAEQTWQLDEGFFAVVVDWETSNLRIFCSSGFFPPEQDLELPTAA